MKLSRWTLVGFLGLLVTCGTSINGVVTPITPKAGVDRSPVVDSLQPTFRWKPVAQADARYDIIILESKYYSFTILESKYSVVYNPRVGREIYYREGLQEPAHTLEVSLQPDQAYFWSVRVRNGEELSMWSGAHDYQTLSACGPLIKKASPFFRFRTPSK